MTVLKSSRTRLDRALDKKDLTLMILAGSDGSEAEVVYDKAVEGVTEPWRKAFLVKDLALLTPDEEEDWFDAEDRYVVLKHVNASDAQKTVVRQGPTSELVLPSGAASLIEIRNAFSS